MALQTYCSRHCAHNKASQSSYCPDLLVYWWLGTVQSRADIKSVSAIMGHADVSMTLNTYASSDADARRVADRLNALTES